MPQLVTLPLTAFTRSSRDTLVPQSDVLRGAMLFSPEIEAMKDQMTAILVRDAEGFFDDPKESEDLQITVRLACEFFIFLQQSNDVPELDAAEYMTGSIRAGMDWFFSIAHTGRVLTGLELQYGFGPKLPSTFSELKASYESVFRQVLDSTHSIKALGLLLSLIQMMFLFMTVYYPSFLSFASENRSD
jgi:hypothetical protein